MIGIHIDGIRRLRARQRDDRGMMMAEVAVAMVVLALSLLGFLAAFASVQNSERYHQGLDVASQAAVGQMRQLQTIPWADVTMWSSDSPPAADPNNCTPVTTTGSAPSGMPSMSTTQTIQGTTVSTTLYISWAKSCGGASGSWSGRPSTYFDTKVVTQVVSWQSKTSGGGGGTTKTETFQTILGGDATSQLPTGVPTS